MGAKKSKREASAFAELGLKDTIAALVKEVQELYLSDHIPWVVGYSGGKDSTAILQLVWLALADLPLERRAKTVHVISTDTLVENPVVASWVTASLEKIETASIDARLPITPHRLIPEVQDSFWVNLIGKGYPSPRVKFRWCTERLKINPSNRFVAEVVRDNGEAILVLGTRKAESSQRASRMKKLEAKRIRERLSPNLSLPNSLVFSPIEDWTNDDVWLFLMQIQNPWGYRNKDLLSMYQGASADGECPLVIDTTTPSCGDSRFGCWVCTLVDEDRSMSAMIQNDDEKEWMQPLLELRNELGNKDDRDIRDFRRMAGHVQLYNDRPIPGPYIQSAREYWLRRVLEAQKWIQEHGPEGVRDMALFHLDELIEIRRIWVVDKHELEDSLPGIYEKVLGEPFPGPAIDEGQVFGVEELHLLRKVTEDDDLQYQLLRELIDIEGRYRTAARRAGLFRALEKAFLRSGFRDSDQATREARLRHQALGAAKSGDRSQLELLLENGGASTVETREDGEMPT